MQELFKRSQPISLVSTWNGMLEACRMKVLIMLMVLLNGMAQLVADSRPNVVFVFADDWGCYSKSYAEIEKNMLWDEEAPTPNLDRLYKEGVLFRNAYVSSPQRTPSRSSLLSGMNFWETGLAAVQDGIGDFQNPSFPMLMRAAGYHAGYSSKVWSPGVPRDAPFGASQYEYESAGTDCDKFSQEIYKRIDKEMSIEDAKEELYAQAKGNFECFLKDTAIPYGMMCEIKPEY